MKQAVLTNKLTANLKLVEQLKSARTKKLQTTENYVFVHFHRNSQVTQPGYLVCKQKQHTQGNTRSTREQAQDHGAKTDKLSTNYKDKEGGDNET